MNVQNSKGKRFHINLINSIRFLTHKNSDLDNVIVVFEMLNVLAGIGIMLSIVVVIGIVDIVV